MSWGGKSWLGGSICEGRDIQGARGVALVEVYLRTSNCMVDRAGWCVFTGGVVVVDSGVVWCTVGR